MFDKIDSITESLVINIAGLQGFVDCLGSKDALRDALERSLAQIFAMKGRLIIVGMGKSGLIARKLAATFSSTGTPAYFVHPAEASHGDLGMIQTGDVILMLSWSGETRELGDILTYAARFDIPTIAITGAGESTLAKRAGLAIICPEVRESCPHNLAPTSSTLLQMAIGDALAVSLLQMRGFSKESFRDFHPGGKLGSSLIPIDTVMYKGADLPLLAQTAPMIDAIGQMSNKAFGLVGLTDSAGLLAGIITDGDIRRYLQDNADGSMRGAMQDTTAGDVMTVKPVVLSPDCLCGRAIGILQEHKISAAFVMEDGKADGKIAGLITILQLLRAGVA